MPRFNVALLPILAMIKYLPFPFYTNPTVQNMIILNIFRSGAVPFMINPDSIQMKMLIEPQSDK